MPFRVDIHIGSNKKLSGADPGIYVKGGEGWVQSSKEEGEGAKNVKKKKTKKTKKKKKKKKKNKKTNKKIKKK